MSNLQFSDKWFFFFFPTGNSELSPTSLAVDFYVWRISRKCGDSEESGCWTSSRVAVSQYWWQAHIYVLAVDGWQKRHRAWKSSRRKQIRLRSFDGKINDKSEPSLIWWTFCWKFDDYLLIKLQGVSTAESGFYKCYARGIKDASAISVHIIELVVSKAWKEVEEIDYEVEIFRIDNKLKILNI